MTTAAFNRIIAATKDFCSKNHNIKTTHFIRLDFRAATSTVVAIALDGYRLSVEHAVAESNEDFTVYVRSNIKLPNKGYVYIELIDKEVFLRCNGFVFGYQQPDGEPFDYEKVLPKNEPQFEIGFNGDYLLSALQAAKASVGSTFKNPVVLEFRSPLEPIVLRTNTDDVKMVLPIRLKSKE